MAYRTESPDTHEVVERLQFERLRRIGRKARFEEGLALVDECAEIMWNALVRRHPDFTTEQLRIEWIRLLHGDDLAARCAEYLRCRQANKATESAAR